MSDKSPFSFTIKNKLQELVKYSVNEDHWDIREGGGERESAIILQADKCVLG